MVLTPGWMPAKHIYNFPCQGIFTPSIGCVINDHPIFGYSNFP